MARLEHFIFGYHRVRIADGAVTELVGLFLRLDICATIGADGSCELSMRYLSRLRATLGQRFSSVVCECSEPRGICGFFRCNRWRIGTLLGLLTVIIAYLLLGSLVWDVRIDGIYGSDAYEVRAALSDCGMHVGSNWRKLDISEIRNDILGQCDCVGWISINRVGGVAYVEVIPDTDGKSPPATEPAYTDIVAAEDCVITDISVTCGTAMVAVGDTVRRGDVLISCLVRGDDGEMELCRAEGRVEGECAVELSVRVPRMETATESRLLGLDSFSIEIFGFSLNILKNRGNHTDECDIIEQRQTITTSGGVRLPLCLVRSYVRCTEQVERELTDERMVEIAARRLHELMVVRLADADLVRLRTGGSFENDEYIMRCYAVVCKSVGAAAVSAVQS